MKNISEKLIKVKDTVDVSDYISTLETISATVEQAIENLTQHDSSDAVVYYFSKSNFNGMMESFSNTWPTDNFKKNGKNPYANDYSFFYGHFGSLIVTRGQCETTTDATGNFANDSRTSYYNADEGPYGTGCFPSLGSDTDDVIALRTQRPDIIRPTHNPCLVLRDSTQNGDTGDKNESQTAKIITGNTGDIPSFSAAMIFAMGSTSGVWYLFDSPDYKGNGFSVNVNKGNTNYEQGVYKYGEPLQVRSATMLVDDIAPNQSLILFSASDYEGDIRILTTDTENVSPTTSSIIVKGDNSTYWYGFPTAATHNSAAVITLTSDGGDNGDGRYSYEYLSSHGLNDVLQSFKRVDVTPIPDTLPDDSAVMYSTAGYQGIETLVTAPITYPSMDDLVWCESVKFSDKLQHQIVFHLSGTDDHGYFTAQYNSQNGDCSDLPAYFNRTGRTAMSCDSVSYSPLPTPTPTPTPTQTPTPTPTPNGYPLRLYFGTNYTGIFYSYNKNMDIPNVTFNSYCLDWTVTPATEIDLCYTRKDGSQVLLKLHRGDSSCPNTIDDDAKAYRINFFY